MWIDNTISLFILVCFKSDFSAPGSSDRARPTSGGSDCLDDVMTAATQRQHDVTEPDPPICGRFWFFGGSGSLYLSLTSSVLCVGASTVCVCVCVCVYVCVCAPHVQCVSVTQDAVRWPSVWVIAACRFNLCVLQQEIKSFFTLVTSPQNDYLL